MKPACPARARRSLPLAVLAFAAIALAGCQSGAGGAGGASAVRLPADDRDPHAATAFVKPADLAATLKGAGEKPLLFHVGFQVLYRGGAIPGSKYAGPGSEPDGIAALKAAVQGVPKDKAIVIYCGCCPWDHCPNMRPAYETLVSMGYTNVRALYTPKNLETDWVNLGYPIEQPAN